jgi:hypothetical protein
MISITICNLLQYYTSWYITTKTITQQQQKENTDIY